MAEIHLAKTSGIAGFEKYVALKMIHPNFSQDEQFILMLIDEAKITVQLQHVNVAQTFDLGRVDRTYYITMEFVDGADLYKLLRRGSERGIDMPVDVAAYIAKEMATGLDYAHRKRDVTGSPLRIVHRDVSPQNVLISHAGEVKLVDFGIAKATMRARQTAVGVIKGKYYYMSPEQAWGDPVDHRTDIFSTGIVLYEMLTGQMLYLEEDLQRLLDLVRKAHIAPPTSLRRDVPPQLERIVMHALGKRRQDRYQSAGDLATDLERFLHVYSPVFTATKVAQYFQKILAEENELPETVPEEEEEPIPRVTMSVTRDQLVADRSEFEDENSMIFDMSQMKPSRGFDEETKEPTLPPFKPAMPLPPMREPNAHTMEMPGDFDDNDDRTVVSAPPGFVDPDSLPAAGRGRSHDHTTAPASAGDFEPTFIEGANRGRNDYSPEDENPTIEHGRPVRDRNPNTARDHESFVGKVPTPDDEGPTRTDFKPARKPRPKQQPAALAASAPQPAVSNLRSPRRSRRTPARGVPVPPPRAPATPPSQTSRDSSSLLSAIVGKAAGPGGPPVRRGGPPPPQPPPMPRPPLQAPQAPQAPQAQRPHAPPNMHVHGSIAFGAPNGQAQAPGVTTPPGMDQAGFPLAAPVQTPNPFLPYGATPQQPTFTQQLRVQLEVDEIPDAFKLGPPTGSRWFFRASLALICVAAGVAIAMFMLRDTSTPNKPSILIRSDPEGARVVINEEDIPGKTPVVFRNAKRGERYKIEVKHEDHKLWTKTVVIPDNVDQLEVEASLD